MTAYDKDNFMSDIMKDLLQGLCAELNIGNPESVLQSGTLDIDDVTVYVEGRDEIYAEELVIYADLGAVPQDKAAEVHRNLLEANLFWAGTGSATIGLHPDTGHAILAYQTPFAGLTPAGLASAVTQFAKIAAYWQRFIASGGETGGAQPPQDDAMPGMMRV